MAWSQTSHAHFAHRLCKYKPGVNVTEACFQQTPLDFLPSSRLVWMNGTSLPFKPTLLTEGTTPKVRRSSSSLLLLLRPLSCG